MPVAYFNPKKNFKKLEKLLHIINVRNPIESTYKKADGRLLILDLLLLSWCTCPRKAAYQPTTSIPALLGLLHLKSQAFRWSYECVGNYRYMMKDSTDDLLNFFFSLSSSSFRPIGLIMLSFPENSKSNFLPKILPNFGIWGPWTDYH